jgi:hypothetical protein
MGDVHWGNVSLLVKASPPNGTPIDYSSYAHVLTKTGSITGYAEVEGYGNYLIYSTARLVVTPQGSEFNFGTGDFTIEGWVSYGYPLTGSVLFHCGSTTNAFAITTAANEITSLYINNVSRFTNLYLAYDCLLPEAHVAIVRNANIVTVYLGGTSIGSWNATGVSIGGNTNIAVGGTYAANVNAQLAHIRVTKGVARYMGNFAVPDPATWVGPVSSARRNRLSLAL